MNLLVKRKPATLSISMILWRSRSVVYLLTEKNDHETNNSIFSKETTKRKSRRKHKRVDLSSWRRYNASMLATAPSAAYLAAQTGSVFYRLHDAGYLHLTGDDRVAFLNRQTTNDLQLLRPDRAVTTVLTSPTARILDVLTLIDEGETLGVITLEGRHDVTARALQGKIFFMDKVTVEDVSAEVAQFDLDGAAVSTLLSQLGFEATVGMENLASAVIAGVKAGAVGRRGLVGIGTRLLVPMAAVDVVTAAMVEAGALALTPDEYHVLRVEAGLPAASAELTDAYTPLEAGLEDFISDKKGCYTGQEVIARQITYDKLTRRLVGLKLASLVEPGARVEVEGKAAGVVTSVAVSPRLGPVALAYIKRPYDAPGTELAAVQDATLIDAQVQALPFTISSLVNTWRLLITEPASGAWNMAVDEAIAILAAQDASPPTLRFYQWQPGTVSLGRHQPLADIDRGRVQARGYGLVRRPTGGRAILHIDELTYSVAGRDDEPQLAGAVLDAYNRLSEGLVLGLRRLGIEAVKASGALRVGPDVSAVCFETPSAYEICVNGRKLMGSAQSRRSGYVLQHGSLPLAGDITRLVDVLAVADEAERTSLATALAAGAVTVETALGRPVTFWEAAAVLIDGLTSALDIDLVEQSLTPTELALAERLVSEQFAHPTWTERV